MGGERVAMPWILSRYTGCWVHNRKNHHIFTPALLLHLLIVGVGSRAGCDWMTDGNHHCKCRWKGLGKGLSKPLFRGIRNKLENLVSRREAWHRLVDLLSEWMPKGCGFYYWEDLNWRELLVQMPASLCRGIKACNRNSQVSRSGIQSHTMLEARTRNPTGSKGKHMGTSPPLADSHSPVWAYSCVGQSASVTDSHSSWVVGETDHRKEVAPELTQFWSTLKKNETG